jgi:hypothetical protein
MLRPQNTLKFLALCSFLALPAAIGLAQSAQAATFAKTITFNEVGAPGFPTATTTIAAPGGSSLTTYDVINNVTGASGADGTQDITVSATASATGVSGTTNNPKVEWQTTSAGRFTSTRGFTKSVSANNPGTLQSTETKVLFDSSLNITDLKATFSSLNTAGILWEYSVLGFLDPSGNPFTAAPVVGPYESTTSFTGTSSPSLGWYVAADKGTVSGVGTDVVTAGTPGSADGNNFALTYDLARLAANTQVGGLIWTTYTQDTRGITNGSSNFTASLNDMTFTNTDAVPTPALLPGLVAVVAGARRRWKAAQ